MKIKNYSRYAVSKMTFAERRSLASALGDKKANKRNARGLATVINRMLDDRYKSRKKKKRTRRSSGSSGSSSRSSGSSSRSSSRRSSSRSSRGGTDIGADMFFSQLQRKVARRRAGDWSA